MSLLVRWGMTDATTVSSFQLDAVDDRIAVRLHYTRAAVPQSVSIYVGSVTGTPPTYRIRIETDSAGVPSGTLYHANATGTFTPTAAGWYTVTFATLPAPLSASTVYHLVVEYASGTIDASNRAAISYQTNTTWGAILANPAQTSTTVVPSWSLVAAQCAGMFVVAFTNGALQGNTGGTAASNLVWGATRTGMRFQLPFSVDIQGVGIRTRKQGSPSDLVLAILDSGGNVLSSATIPTSTITTSMARYEVFFSSVLTLAANQTYRLVAYTALGTEASSASAHYVQSIDFGSASWSFDGNNAQLTTGSAQAGPWTDTSSADAVMWLIFDALTAIATLNTVADVLDEGNWQADAWSPRIADDTEFQAWAASVLGRANSYVKWRVGDAYYSAQAGSTTERIFKEAEMQHAQYLLCTALAKIADTSDHDATAPWVKDGAALRATAAEHKARVEELLAPYDTIRGRPGRVGPYFKGVTTVERVVERFDPETGV